MKISPVLQRSLTWNPSIYVNNQYLLNDETVRLFEQQLEFPCRQTLRNFFILLSDPLADIKYFTEYIDLIFLVLALEFYGCMEMIDDLIKYIDEKSVRNYIATLI